MPEVNNNQFKNLRNDYSIINNDFGFIEKYNSTDEVNINDGQYGVEEIKERLESFYDECQTFLIKYKEGFLDGILFRQKEEEYNEMIKDVESMKKTVKESLYYVEDMLSKFKQ